MILESFLYKLKPLNMSGLLFESSVYFLIIKPNYLPGLNMRLESIF